MRAKAILVCSIIIAFAALNGCINEPDLSNKQKNANGQLSEARNLTEKQRIEEDVSKTQCPNGMLDCFGDCYYPKTEDCISAGHRTGKIVERSVPEIYEYPPIYSEPSATEGKSIIDLMSENKIEVESRGSEISSVTLEIRRLVGNSITVKIPVGTLFVPNGAGVQEMVSTNEVSAELERNETILSVPVACTNLHKSIPGTSDRFEIVESPNQEELQLLLPAIENGTSYYVKQAAIWIVTDNANYDDLGTLVRSYNPFGGTRAINEYEAAEAMLLIDKAGIDIEDKAIWEDREIILEGLKDATLREWLVRKGN